MTSAPFSTKPSLMRRKKPGGGPAGGAPPVGVISRATCAAPRPFAFLASTAAIAAASASMPDTPSTRMSLRGGAVG